MRISEKIELGYDGDVFVGCERTSERFAVVVRGLGHDDEEAASRIGLLGSWERPLPNSRNLCYRGENAKEGYKSARDGVRRW